MKKTFLSLMMAAVLALTACAPVMPSTDSGSVLASVGSPDPTFGVNGTVVTDFDNESYDVGNDIALQPDGKIIVAGYGGQFGGFALARYNSGGSLDTTFDGDGKVAVDFGSSYKGGLAALALQPDGRIILAGQSYNGSNNDFTLVRYTSDGSPDTAFGVNGNVATDFKNSDDFCYAVALQPDGKILMAGRTSNGSDFDFALARYNSDGSLDAAFGEGGKVISDFGSDWGSAVVIQQDGSILVSAGTTLARYNSDGSLDKTFGQGGSRLALQPDGKILVLGGGYAVTRYMDDGSLDTTFGRDGIATADFGENDVGADFALDPDGRIVVAGLLRQSAANNNIVFALTRYNSDGSLDTTLDGDGMITTSIGGIQDQASAIVVQPDGKIIVAGSSFNSSDADFALVRYNLETQLASATVQTFPSITPEPTATNTCQVPTFNASDALSDCFNGSGEPVACTGLDLLSVEAGMIGPLVPERPIPTGFILAFAEPRGTAQEFTLYLYLDLDQNPNTGLDMSAGVSALPGIDRLIGVTLPLGEAWTQAVARGANTKIIRDESQVSLSISGDTVVLMVARELLVDKSVAAGEQTSLARGLVAPVEYAFGGALPDAFTFYVGTARGIEALDIFNSDQNIYVPLAMTVLEEALYPPCPGGS